eukprot:2234482-Pyramimonas_sp.AAC.1
MPCATSDGAEGHQCPRAARIDSPRWPRGPSAPGLGRNTLCHLRWGGEAPIPLRCAHRQPTLIRGPCPASPPAAGCRLGPRPCLQ